MSFDPIRFAPGELVYLRHFQREAISAVSQLRVVRHDHAGLLLWSGTAERYWVWDMPDGRVLRATPLDEWVSTDKVPVARLTKHGTLAWHPTGADYSLRLFFAPDGAFRNWYANLELAAVLWRDATAAGVDTVDWDLDIWIEPDRSWRWKDEEEFAERLRSPEHYWVHDEQRVRDAGEQALKLLTAGAFPFDASLLGYRPDPSWTPPPHGTDPDDAFLRPRVC